MIFFIKLFAKNSKITVENFVKIVDIKRKVIQKAMDKLKRD